MCLQLCNATDDGYSEMEVLCNEYLLNILLKISARRHGSIVLLVPEHRVALSHRKATTHFGLVFILTMFCIVRDTPEDYLFSLSIHFFFAVCIFLVHLIRTVKPFFFIIYCVSFPRAFSELLSRKIMVYFPWISCC